MKAIFYTILGAVVAYILLFTPHLSRQETIQRRAFYKAVWCAKENPKTTYQKIEWFVVPGDYMVLQDEQGPFQAIGFYSSKTHSIYVVDHLMNNVDVLAHEALHALGKSHDDPVFERCGISTDQLMKKYFITREFRQDSR